MSDPFIDVDISHRNMDRWIVRTSIRDFLRSNYPKMKGRLLDVGCGKMPYRAEILSQSSVDNYVGLDIEGALVYDEAIRPDATWDGEVIPFESDSFDCAIITEVFEHVAAIDVLLKEVKRILRPGGLCFFTTPFIWPYHETPYDCQRWTSFGLRNQFEKTHFKVMEMASVGNWHSALAQMLGLWIIRSPMNRYVRVLLRYPLFLLQRMLFAMDSSSLESENAMPRMCVGIIQA